MLHLRLLLAGVALIVLGLIVSVVLPWGGGWVWVGLALEVLGVVVLGINIGIMMKNRKPGGPPR